MYGAREDSSHEQERDPELVEAQGAVHRHLTVVQDAGSITVLQTRINKLETDAAPWMVACHPGGGSGCGSGCGLGGAGASTWVCHTHD